MAASVLPSKMANKCPPLFAKPGMASLFMPEGDL
jgi:hypothetical protein